MAERTRACSHCHGKQGRAGPDGYYPRLAGKPAAYLYNQLLNFREGRRHYSLMTGLLEPLTDAYLMEMAQYFAGLNLPYPPPTPVAATTPAQLARGKSLVTQGDPQKKIPACINCHGDRLTGALPHVPGLLGLTRDYLNAQLGRDSQRYFSLVGRSNSARGQPPAGPRASEPGHRPGQRTWLRQRSGSGAGAGKVKRSRQQRRCTLRPLGPRCLPRSHRQLPGLPHGHGRGQLCRRARHRDAIWNGLFQQPNGRPRQWHWRLVAQ